jgi:DNA-binding TFAR19-related protein (PDSD5 family)
VPTPFTELNSRARDSVTKYGGFPLGTRALELPDSQVTSRFLDAFGRPERSQTCSCERQDDASVGQALHVNNGNTLNDKIRAKKGRVSRWLAENISDEQALQRLYLLALSRPPTAAERQRLMDLIAEGRREPGTTDREILEDLFWAVLSSREFLFNQ